jgi:glutamate racemase
MDTLILGCTHYPLLAPVIQDVVGPDVHLISSGDETALEVAAILDFKELENDLDTVPAHQFYATGDVVIFDRLATEWLGQPVRAEKVEVSGVDA